MFRSSPPLTNNWQSHRLKLATLGAFQSGEADLIARAHVLSDKHIAANLRPDGATVDFLQRDALHYVTYSLDSQLMAVLAARAHGQDWYAYEKDGRSLPRTIAWLSAFASGRQEHIEFVHSFVPFDRQRAAWGLETFQNKPWNPATAKRLYKMIALLDPKWAALSDQIQRLPTHQSKEDPGRPEEWLDILGQEARR